MCGFFIEYKRNNFFDSQEKFNISSKLIKHRGDQALKSYVDENIRINFYRLKIMDLSEKGDQPMFDCSKRYLIAFNGEIYNARELKKHIPEVNFKGNSDTELLINLYAKFKNKVLDLIEGMFSFVIYDKQDKKCFIARDRFGIKPLYYFIDKHSLIFSSEIKPILDYKKVNEFNNDTFSDFFFRGLLDHNNLTFFKNVMCLEPSHYIHASKDKMIKKKYWDIAEPLFDYKKDDLEYLQELLTYSIDQHLISDRKIGFFLSGGTDSSALASICSKNLNYLPNTYTYDFSRNEFSESRKAKKIAKKLKIKNNLSILKAENVEKNFDNLVQILESPFTSIRLFGVDKIYKKAKEDGLKVICEGHGGDEMMGGYGYNFLAHQSDLLNVKKNLTIRQKLEKKKLDNFLKHQGEYTTDGTSFSDHNFFDKDFIKKYKSNSILEKRKNLNCLMQSQFNDLRFVKLPRVLKYTDRISMSHGIETRVPLLNHRLFNFCFHLANEKKFKKNESRYLFKKTLKNMGALYNFEKNKQDIVDPQKSWLKKDLKSFVFDNLNSKNFENCDFFDKKYVRNYFETFLNKEQKSSFLMFITLSSLIFMKNFKSKFGLSNYG